MARLPSGAVRAHSLLLRSRGKERRRVGGSFRRRSSLAQGSARSSPSRFRSNAPAVKEMSSRAVEPAGLVLQTDPEELPHPGGRLKGATSQAMPSGGAGPGRSSGIGPMRGRCCWECRRRIFR
jgi:hypothetical protein